MTTSDVTALVLAGIANIAGLGVTIALWRRHQRRRRALRSRHPSARPPLAVDLVESGDVRRLRLRVLPSAAETTIDIVSFRSRTPVGPWEGEPLGEPMVIAPGGEAVLASSLAPETSEVDVVVAWTTRDDTGAATGSQLFRVPPERGAPTSTRPAAGVSGRGAAILAMLLLGSGLLIGLSILGDDSDGGATSAPPTSAPATSGQTAAPATTPAPTAPVAPPATPAPAPPPSEPTTSEPTTSEPTTSEPTTSEPTTSAPAATTPPATTQPASTTIPDGPVVRAEGRVEPCRFGDECLVVGFTIAGFDEPQDEYVCEFEDGSRFTFSFVGDGAQVACATGSPTATITVEVAGVRSETITRP